MSTVSLNFALFLLVGRVYRIVVRTRVSFYFRVQTAEPSLQLCRSRALSRTRQTRRVFADIVWRLNAAVRGSPLPLWKIRAGINTMPFRDTRPLVLVLRARALIVAVAASKIYRACRAITCSTTVERGTTLPTLLFLGKSVLFSNSIFRRYRYDFHAISDGANPKTRDFLNIIIDSVLIRFLFLFFLRHSYYTYFLSLHTENGIP